MERRGKWQTQIGEDRQEGNEKQSKTEKEGEEGGDGD